MAVNTPNPTPPVIKGYTGSYDTGFIDLYSLANNIAAPNFKQQIYPELFKNHGGAFGMLEFLQMAGREMFVKGRKLIAFEETHDETVATLGTQIATGSAGATVYFKLGASDYDANGNGPIRKDVTVYFPGSFFGKARPVGYAIQAISTSGKVGNIDAGTGADTVYTAKPVSSSTQVTSAIAVGSKLIIGDTKYAEGTGQPKAKTVGNLQRSFYPQIAKETMEIFGGANSYEIEPVLLKNGTTRLFDKAMMETDMRLNRQMNYAILLSESNTNSLTQTDKHGNSKTVFSTKGFLPHVDEYGMELVVSSGQPFEFYDWDAVKDLWISQGVMANEAFVPMGSKRFQEIENESFDFIREVSDTDLYDKEMQALGARFTNIEKNGIKFRLTELQSFSDPTGLGASGFDLKNQGFIIPITQVATSINNTGEFMYAGKTYGDTQSGSKITLPNMAIAYMGGYGEDRRRVIKDYAGMNGLGYDTKHEYDLMNKFWLTEFTLFLMNTNQITWLR